MGIVQSQLGLVVLWAAAGLTALWILGPLVLFLTPLRRNETEVRDDPREAQPYGKDPDYERRFAELRALGFEPAGKTRERFRFFTPLHWRWVSSGARWLVSPDRKVFVEVHRLAGGFPQRMSANTTFEGGGLLVTSTTPTGRGGEIGERYRRVEVGDVGPDELLRQHDRQVSDFARDAGLRVRAATLSEVARESVAISEPFITRARFAGLYAIAMIYLMPVWSIVSRMGRAHRLPWFPPVILCGAAALFALIRLTVLPEFRRIRWVAFAGLLALCLGVPLLLPRWIPRHHSNRGASVHASDATPPTGTEHP